MKNKNFLILIFSILALSLFYVYFLTTTIEVDKGITVKLPPWTDEPLAEMEYKARNVYAVVVNADDQLLVRGEPMDISELRKNTKIFIANPDGLLNMAEEPSKALISLKNDRGTSYEVYLQVYNELKGAYQELWNAEAKRLFNKQYKDLETMDKKQIRIAFPLIISEAEPTSFEE